MTILTKLIPWVLFFSLILCTNLSAYGQGQTKPLELAFSTLSVHTISTVQLKGSLQPLSVELTTSSHKHQILDILKRAQKYSTQKRYEESLNVALPAMKFFNEETDLSNEMYGSLLEIIGVALSESGRWEQALEFFSKALLVFRNINDKDSLGLTLFNMGRTYEYQKKGDSMFDAYDRALKLFKEANNANGQAMVLLNLGYFRSSECPLSQALEKLNDVQKLKPKITWPELKSSIAGLKALFVHPEVQPIPMPEMLSDERHPNWILTLERMKQIVTESHAGMIVIRNGEEIFVVNDPSASGLLSLVSTDAELFKVISTDPRLDDLNVKMQLLQVAQQLVKHGVEHRQKENFRLAWSSYRMALMLALRYHDREGLDAVSGSLMVLRQILERGGVPEKEKEYVNTRNWIAYDAAHILLAWPADFKVDNTTVASHRLRYRLTILTGNYRAVQYQSMSLYCSATEVGLPAMALEALLYGLMETSIPTILGVAEPLEDLSRFKQLWSTYIEARKKLNKGDITIDLYIAYQRALDHFAYERARAVSAGGPFGHHLSFRVSEFLQPLERDHVWVLTHFGSASDTLLAAEHTLGKALKDWMARSHRSNRLFIRPGLLGSVGEILPAKLAEIFDSAKRLDADFLFYLKFPIGFGVWLVTVEGEIIGEILPDPIEKVKEVIQSMPYSDSLREIMGANTRGVRKVFRPEEMDDINAVLENLYSTLFPPKIAEVLNVHPERRLILIPDATLNYVPFSALRANGRYLIQDREVMSLPSITAWLLIESEAEVGGGFGRNILQSPSTRINGSPQSNPQRIPAVVIGDPEFPENEGLHALPGAKQEAKAIAKELNVSPKIGRQATLDSVFKDGVGSRILHLATHGIIMAENPMDSFLALTDGRLTAQMLYEWDRPLRTNLVVLSACETALGGEHPDSIIGLSNGFLVAGANAVISSLWLVPDMVTSRLMTNFYKELKHGKNSSAALRKAQLNLLDEPETHHPYWWAAFRLNGNPSNPFN